MTETPFLLSVSYYIFVRLMFYLLYLNASLNCRLTELEAYLFLKREWKIKAEVGKPQVTYRETITKSSSTTYTFDKTIAGKEAYIALTLSLEPNNTNENQILCNIKERGVPENIITSIKNGVNGALKSGIKMGYECIGITCNITSVI